MCGNRSSATRGLKHFPESTSVHSDVSIDGIPMRSVRIRWDVSGAVPTASSSFRKDTWWIRIRFRFDPFRGSDNCLPNGEKIQKIHDIWLCPLSSHFPKAFFRISWSVGSVLWLHTRRLNRQKRPSNRRNQNRRDQGGDQRRRTTVEGRNKNGRTAQWTLVKLGNFFSRRMG